MHTFQYRGHQDEWICKTIPMYKHLCCKTCKLVVVSGALFVPPHLHQKPPLPLIPPLKKIQALYLLSRLPHWRLWNRSWGRSWRHPTYTGYCKGVIWIRICDFGVECGAKEENCVKFKMWFNYYRWRYEEDLFYVYNKEDYNCPQNYKMLKLLFYVVKHISPKCYNWNLAETLFSFIWLDIYYIGI